jgi:hypothetical protein
MRKWKMKESPIDVEEPKLFKGVMVALVLCIPVWMAIIHFVF